VTNFPFCKDYFNGKPLAILAKSLIIHEMNKDMEKLPLQMIQELRNKGYFNL